MAKQWVEFRRSDPTHGGTDPLMFQESSAESLTNGTSSDNVESGPDGDAADTGDGPSVAENGHKVSHADNMM